MPHRLNGRPDKLEFCGTRERIAKNYWVFQWVGIVCVSKSLKLLLVPERRRFPLRPMTNAARCASCSFGASIRRGRLNLCLHRDVVSCLPCFSSKIFCVSSKQIGLFVRFPAFTSSLGYRRMLCTVDPRLFTSYFLQYLIVFFFRLGFGSRSNFILFKKKILANLRAYVLQLFYQFFFLIFGFRI